MTSDVVIAGGGIGGAVLARLLARGGKRVVVLEKGTGPPALVRPEILWPATVERLRDLLPGVPEESWLVPLEGLRMTRGGRTLVEVKPRIFGRAGVRPWSTDPTGTRELLLKDPPFELRRGVEVVGVLNEGGRVVGVRGRDTTSGREQEYRASWTVGDDGVHSPVRQGCGIPLETTLMPVDLVVFGTPWPAELPVARARVWFNPRWESGVLLLGIVPMPAGCGAALLTVQPWVFDDPGRLNGALRLFETEEPEVKQVLGGRSFPDDMTRVRRPWGNAPRYGTDGAVLIGDAAHPVTPAGGQGSNLSVADACTLAELLLAGSPRVVEEYERRRRPAVERSLWFSRQAVRVLGLPSWLFNPLFRLVPPLFRLLSRWPEAQAAFLRRAGTAFLDRPAKA